MVTPFFLASPFCRGLIAIGALVAIAESITDPVTTILIGKIFRELGHLGLNETSSSTFMSKVKTYSLLLVGATAYSACLNALGYYLWMSIGYSLGHVARKRLYVSISVRPSQWLDEKGEVSGTLVMHYKDIQDIEVAGGITAYEILAMFSGCCLQVGVAFYYSWAVTLVCLAGIPLLFVIGFLFSPQLTKRILKSKEILDIISEKVKWALSALQTVKVFQRERYEWLTVHKLLERQQKSSISYWALFNIQQGICRAIVLLIFVQGFYFGSYMVRNHGLNAGHVVTVFWSCLNASGLLQTLIGHLIEWNKGCASAQRLKEELRIDKEKLLHDEIGLMPGVLTGRLEALEALGWDKWNSRVLQVDTGSIASSSSSWSAMSFFGKPEHEQCTHCARTLDPSVKPGKSSSGELHQTASHIVFSDIDFRYPCRPETVFSGLNIEFMAGKLTFVIGPSGSGKSTIATLLSKQYAWDAGEIEIDGHGIDLLSNFWIQENVFICEQNPKIFDISIADNVRIGSFRPEQVTNEQVEIALRESCADFVWSIPGQAEAQAGHGLSGGQKQRIALARARARNAPITIYDESLNALDPTLQQMVLSNLIHYRQGKTTIIITHDSSVILEGHTIYYIDNGRAERYRSKSDAIRAGRLRAADSSSAENPYTAQKNCDRDELQVVPTSALRIENSSLGNDTIFSVSLQMYKSIPAKPMLYVGLVLAVFHAAINPVFAFIFSKLVMGILSPSARQITMWAMLVLMCALLDGIVSAGKITINIVSERWLREMRERIFSGLLSCAKPTLTAEEVAYYMKLLMSDAEKCAQIISLYWPNVLSMLVLGNVGLIWALIVGWKLTLVGIALLPVFVMFNHAYKALTTYWMGRRELLRAQVMRLMVDLTSTAGFRTLKAHRLESFFKEVYNSREAKLNSITSRMVLETGIGYALLKCFPYALEALVLWYGMYLIAKGEYMSETSITIFSLLMFTIITIDQLTSTIGSVGNGFEALLRLIEADSGNLPAPPHTRDRPSPVAGSVNIEWNSLRFAGVGFTFANGRSLLGSFDEDIQKGETIAILGPSGVGKTTLALMLLRLVKPTHGEIIVDRSLDLQTISEFEIRRSVTLVGQMPLDFFDGTIEENILYGLNENDETGTAKLLDICKTTGVDDFVSKLDSGYDTRIANGMLSGGQLQRLGFARALIRQPKVLILDESTSALDSKSKDLVEQTVVQLKERRDIIIIIITHDTNMAKIADRTIRL